MAGDDEEGGVDAEAVLALDELGEGPVGVGTGRQVVGEGAQQALELPARGGVVAGARLERGATQRARDGARRPAPQVVDVVGQGDGEGGVGGVRGRGVRRVGLARPAIVRGCGGVRRREGSPGPGLPARRREVERLREEAAQHADVPVERRVGRVERRLRGEEAELVREAPVLVALRPGVFVPGGQDEESRCHEVERHGEAGVRDWKGADEGGGLVEARERARRHVGAAGDRRRGLGRDRDGRHPGDGPGRVRQRGALRELAVAHDLQTAAGRVAERPQDPGRLAREMVGDVDEQRAPSGVDRSPLDPSRCR